MQLFLPKLFASLAESVVQFTGEAVRWMSAFLRRGSICRSESQQRIDSTFRQTYPEKPIN